MKYLQKIGKSLMLPVAVLPVCGILMGIGYLLCPASMQGGAITGLVPKIGYYMTTAGSAIINNMAILFVIGVSLGMSDDNSGVACLSGIVSWLVITFLLSPDKIKIFMPSFLENEIVLMAYQKIQTPFIGIIAGIIGAECYNRFKGVKFPEMLAFFSGKRFVAIVSMGVSLVAALVLLFVWPAVFALMVFLGQQILKLGYVGAGLYAFFNRLLIPSGLHHALNNVFWFDTIGIGDLTKYWAGKTSADVSWSLGMYMSGFFPCMMFGIPAMALAFYRTAKDKKAVRGILFSAAGCAFLCGLSEPFEFLFMFTAFPLYVVYSVMYGLITILTCALGFRAGFSFSAGATDLLFSASLPAAAKTWLIIPLGIVSFALFYFVTKFMIIKFDMKTPGREDSDGTDEGGTEGTSSAPVTASEKTAAILAAIGGASNVVSVDCCATRLRMELKDSSKVNAKAAKKAGAMGVSILSSTSVQVIIGLTVQQTCDELKELLASDAAYAPADAATASPEAPGADATVPNDTVDAGACTAAEALQGASAGARSGAAQIHHMPRPVRHGETICICEDDASEVSAAGEINDADAPIANGETAEKADESTEETSVGDTAGGAGASSEFTYELQDPLGIHARPAGRLAELVKKHDARVTISANGKTVDAASLMAILTLGASKGMEVRLTAEGPDAEKVIEELKEFLESNL